MRLAGFIADGVPRGNRLVARNKVGCLDPDVHIHRNPSSAKRDHLRQSIRAIEVTNRVRRPLLEVFKNPLVVLIQTIELATHSRLPGTSRNRVIY